MAIEHQSPLSESDPLNYYQWLDLTAFEEDPGRIRAAIREKQKQLASSDDDNQDANSERRRLKAAVSTLLTPARKAEYDSTIELELRVDDWNDLSSFPRSEPIGVFPSLPATVGSFPPAVVVASSGTSHLEPNKVRRPAWILST